jgi:FkbM family methyltransferase
VVNIVNYLKRPEYIWRPRQVIRRFLRIGKKPSHIEDIGLPWGAEIRVQTDENVGADIYYYGVFDPIVPETIWRLLDSGETAIDVGANIGQNTSAMAVRAASAGHVIAFEPHPLTFEQLQRNVENWRNNNYAPIQLQNLALGVEEGEASLQVTGYLSGASLDREGSGVKVPVRRLDSFIVGEKAVGLCKIDVEGHELSVMKGAQNSFSRKLVRDVIFEDFKPMPSAVVGFLRDYGFETFQLISGRLRPSLRPISEMRKDGDGFSYNYLATLAPSRAVARFRSFGWKCLMSL